MEMTVLSPQPISHLRDAATQIDIEAVIQEIVQEEVQDVAQVLVQETVQEEIPDVVNVPEPPSSYYHDLFNIALSINSDRPPSTGWSTIWKLCTTCKPELESESGSRPKKTAVEKEADATMYKVLVIVYVSLGLMACYYFLFYR